MMESNTRVSLMIMYEDESVDIRYGNGAQLQLSPCGCEFMLVKPTDSSAHPLQPIERVRQRTKFTISTYKELMVAALAFRNKYAARPYLPEELIPADHKKPFFSVDSDVQWPEWSSCDAEVGPGRETIVRSEEGRAALMLSPSSEEFSIEFMCSLSRPQNQHLGGQRQPETMYQCTSVIQHHSCHTVAPVWSYPLSLARHLRMARLSKLEDDRAEGGNDLTQAHGRVNTSDMSSKEGRRSHLPQALPLACPSPHWHRWKLKDPLATKEHSDHDLPKEPVKVMWCHGITYRILSGAVSIVEVSPGDGSVIRSDGVLNTYFIHHKPELPSSPVREVRYHLNNLPPDVPGQLYSICTTVSRASRILSCYNEAKQSLKNSATPSCLQEGGHSWTPATTEGNLSNPFPVEQRVDVTQAAVDRSDLVATELEKIKRFNFVLENTHLLRSETRCAELESVPAEEVGREEVNENCIAEALRRTSKAIEDIDALISAATLT